MAQRHSGQSEFDVVIVSPNVAVDSYYILPQLEVGGVNRAQQVLHTAGGKGNNMARALTLLGGRALVLGVVGGRAGEFIVEELDREGIGHDLVWVAGETRRCSTLIVPAIGEATVALESGCPAGEQAAEQLLQRVVRNAPWAPFLSITGSLLPDLSPHYYARLIEQVANRPEVTVCLDSAGEPLRLAAEAGPKIIKVNWHEYRSAFGNGSAPKWSSVAATFLRLAQKGVEILIITDGAQGAYVFAPGTPPFQVVTRLKSWVSTVGAGDTFMAGLLLALGRGESLENAACFASAAAAASLQKVGCGFLNRDDVGRFLSETRVSRLVV